MKAKGAAHKYGNNVNTDEIIPAKFLNTTDARELASHCMEGIRGNFAKKVKKGDVIVAGRNFGCGSSREHAPTIIKMVGISAILAKSVARIFFRNSINVGLPVLICDTEKINDRDELKVDLAGGTIEDISNGVLLTFSSIPDVMLKILNEGGLLPYIKKHGDFKL